MQAASCLAPLLRDAWRRLSVLLRFSTSCWFAASAICTSRSRSLCWRAIRKPATATPIETIVTKMVASALMSGLTPSRTFENTTIGRVLDPGPATKLVITRSSSDSVNASSHPDSSAGIDRQRDQEKDLGGSRAEILRGLLERVVHAREPRLHDHRHDRPS